MFGLEERVRFLKCYGTHSMSTSLLQPGMGFFDVPGIGFIAHRMKWGTAIALAEPVCDEKHRQIMVSEFLRHYKDAVFIQVSSPFAHMLHDVFGYHATQWGVEPVVDIKSFTLKGRKKQVVRTAVNRAAHDGVVFLERSSADPGIHGLTDTWVRTRTLKGKKLTFLIRPMEDELIEDVRRFYAYAPGTGRLLGMIHFDPIYANGTILGYVPNISRFAPDFRQGIFYALMVHAMEKFREEGVGYVNLGLSPFAVDDGTEGFESGIAKLMCRLFYQYGNNFYNYKGLHFTKQRFQGEEIKSYCAHRHRLPLTLFAFFVQDL